MVCGPALAQPTLTFPQIADGGGIRAEIALTNPSSVTENGTVFFWRNSGQPLPLGIDGAERTSMAFSIPPSGALKISTDGGGELRVGYVTVVSTNGGSLLAGNIIYNYNGSEVSVPASPLSDRYHAFVERNAEANSGFSFANPLAQAAHIALNLFSSEGELKLETEITLNPGEKDSRFVNEIFENTPAEIEGSVQAFSSQKFAMIGLRQRSDGALATLGASPTAFIAGSSQLLFAIDTGIDLTSMGFTPEQLESQSVLELTGFQNALNSQFIHIRNIHPDNAVTIHIRYFNEQCQDVLDFLLVVPCGGAVDFDPFNFQLPDPITFNTRVRFFGPGQAGTSSASPMSGTTFGKGRFLVTATAVGASNQGDAAQFLFPRELTEPGLCNANSDNIGATFGLTVNNLHVCDARTMSFNFLSGFQSEASDAACRGPVSAATSEALAQTAFARELVLQGLAEEPSIACFLPGQPNTCGALAAVQAAGDTTCAFNKVGATVEVFLDQPTLTLFPDSFN